MRACVRACGNGVSADELINSPPGNANKENNPGGKVVPRGALEVRMIHLRG